ncbi:MAG: hypothetical protein ACI4YB_02615 [Oscillospiraceae bacterium]
MAKTIKFNLICDGKPVRTIEDLQNNFSIEDILAYYNNKLLHRWLDVRGYKTELEEVNKIDAEKPVDIIKRLISIFNIEINENDVEKGVYILDYLDERKELYSIYEQDGFKVKGVLDDYQTGYHQLIDTIIENNSDITKIKSAISEMLKEYFDIFEINHRALFYKLFHHAPIAIFVLLTFEEARDFYLPVKINVKNDDALYDDIDCKYTEEFETFMSDKAQMYKAICAMVTKTDNILGEYQQTFSGVTDGYWKDLEEKGKKYMIISMDSGDFVRSAGEKDGDLGSTDIKNRFVILDGIDYKSNYATHVLRYMEV